MMFFILTLLFAHRNLSTSKICLLILASDGFSIFKTVYTIRISWASKSSFGINIYELHKASLFVGIYFAQLYLLRDAHLIKRVLTIDFNSFHDRGVYCNPVHDPLSYNLFAMPGQRWKNLRAKLTPTFTSRRLNSMLVTIMDEGERLQNYLAE